VGLDLKLWGLLKRDGPNTSTAVHDSLGLIFNPLEKAKITADCLGRVARVMNGCW